MLNDMVFIVWAVYDELKEENMSKTFQKVQHTLVSPPQSTTGFKAWLKGISAVVTDTTDVMPATLQSTAHSWNTTSPTKVTINK